MPSFQAPAGASEAPIADAARARLARLAALAILIAIVSIYLPVHRFEFLDYDDSAYVQRNVDIQNGLTWDSLIAVFTRSYISSWHPVAMVSHAIDVSLFGHNAGMHHVMSVVFHIVNSLLVLLVWYRLTGSLVQSAFLAAIWAVHPQHVEAVAWISSRKDLLSTLLMILALLEYTAYVKRGGTGRYLLVALMLILGLLAKPMLVTFPFVLLMLDYWPLGRMDGKPAFARLVLEKVPLLLLCAGFMIVTQLVQTEGGAVRSIEDFPIRARIENGAIAYGAYVVKAFWPTGLSAFYPHTMGHSTPLQIWGSAIAVASLSALALVQWRRRPYLFVGWFWFLGTLVPVIGLVQFGAHGMADRYTYVAHLGLFTAAIWLGEDILSRRPSWRPAALIGAFTLLVAAASVSAKYVPVFRNDVTLFRYMRDTVRPHPNVLMGLGTGLLDRGAISEAKIVFESAMGMEPRHDNFYNNVGICWNFLGRLDLADKAFADGIEYMPEDAMAKNNRALSSSKLATIRRTIESLKANVEKNPKDYTAIQQLAESQIRAGMLLDAEKAYLDLIEAWPETPLLQRRLGDIYGYTERYELAVTAYEKALALGDDPQRILYPLAASLRAAGREGEARKYLMEAISLSPPSLDAEFMLERIMKATTPRN